MINLPNDMSDVKYNAKSDGWTLKNVDGVPIE